MNNILLPFISHDWNVIMSVLIEEFMFARLVCTGCIEILFPEGVYGRGAVHVGILEFPINFRYVKEALVFR